MWKSQRWNHLPITEQRNYDHLWSLPPCRRNDVVRASPVFFLHPPHTLLLPSPSSPPTLRSLFAFISGHLQSPPHRPPVLLQFYHFYRTKATTLRFCATLLRFEGGIAAGFSAPGPQHHEAAQAQGAPESVTPSAKDFVVVCSGYVHCCLVFV